MSVNGIVRSIGQVFVFSAVVLMSQFSLAVVSTGFFQSEQQVVNQSKRARQQATSKGFAEVLVKLSGTKQILLRPELRGALQNPSAFLQKYTYFSESDQEGDSQWIRLEFNSDQIESIFYEQKLPLWSKDRPPLVFWFGVDAEQGRQIFSRQASGNLSLLQERVVNAASRRGLTVQFPHMDEQDQLTINLSDIWSLDMNAITNASRRYNAQLVVIGKIAQSPSGNWYGQWGLEFEGRAYWYEGTAQDFDIAFDRVMDNIATELGNVYSFEVGHDVEEAVLISVENINSLKDYADVSQVLEKLLPVNHVAVREAKPGLLLFEVNVQGGALHLVPSLKLQPQLRAVARARAIGATIDPVEPVGEDVAPVSPLETVLSYRWFSG